MASTIATDRSFAAAVPRTHPRGIERAASLLGARLIRWARVHADARTARQLARELARPSAAELHELHQQATRLRAERQAQLGLYHVGR